MINKLHKKITLLIGAGILASLIVNLFRISIQNPKNYIDAFRLTKDVGLPWIPYVSIATVFLSGVSALGLMKHKQWGFYGMYLAYLTSISIVWFPFFPGFLLQFPAGLLKGISTLFLIFALLVFLIYLHYSGKKRSYFNGSAKA